MIDSALRLSTAFLLNYLHGVLHYSELYGLTDNDVGAWSRIARCNCVRNNLPSMCTSNLKAICDGLGVELFVCYVAPVVTSDSKGHVVAVTNETLLLTRNDETMFYA